jgi:multidrug resistance efflux pump
MSNRVNVNITARDLTRAELGRMRRNFNALGDDMSRAVGNRTRANFSRLSQSITTARRDLTSLRGAIPDQEFYRLDRAIRQAQHGMRRGFNRTSETQMARIARQVNRVSEGFRDLDRNSNIRVRVDTSALRRADALLMRGLRDRTQRIRVRVDPDTHTFGASLRRGLLAPLRGIGRLVTGTLSDGIGQGIADAGKAAGPIFATVLVAAIVAALAVVGAALSGLLVTAFGLAFVGISGLSAATSQKVKDQWSKTLKGLKKDFKEVGEPMIPVLDRAIERLGKLADQIAPKFKASIEASVPETEKFLNLLTDGFLSFGRAAFKPIMEAWKVFAPVFGQEWNEFMDELGNSFGRMADLVRQHPTEIAAALDVVFEAIDLLVDTVTFFGKVWVFTLQNAGDAVGFLLQALASMVSTSLNMFGALLEGADAALSWIPGMSGKLDAAKTSFAGFRDNVVGQLNDMAQSAFGWDNALNRANRKRQLDADISTWQHKLAIARADLKKTSDQKAQAKLKADISDLTSKIARARGELANLNGKTATTYINTVMQTFRQGERDFVNSRATGGVRGLSAAATGGVRSNMTLVGEHGPEVVNLAPGSHVRSNGDSRRLLGGGGGGSGVPIQVNLVLDGRIVAKALIDPMRGEIADKGGNVQSVLGRRGHG